MEYLILVALVAVAAIAVVGTVGRNIREQYANVSRAVRGEGQRLGTTAVRSTETEARGMHDFGEAGGGGGGFRW